MGQLLPGRERTELDQLGLLTLHTRLGPSLTASLVLVCWKPVQMLTVVLRTWNSCSLQI